ncbi:MAG TPA: C4-type zinc ribbon domain-containing protein [Actinomycetota bacterium]|nr:C4-type zinc ribbon domain-containing protein [Actinomycetota bacterium]
MAVTLESHMDVDASALQQLLVLQDEDTSIKRLEERRRSLPEAQELATTNEALAELTADLEIAQKQFDEVAREQDRREGEIAIVEQKIAREEERLFGGKVSNPKELGALQAEVQMLKKKKGDLEDGLLEIMVHKEDAAATLDRLKNEQADTARKSEALTASVGTLIGQIDAQLQEHAAKRDAAATPLTPELLQLYEKIRATKNGVGAAALERGTCQGCHTQLPNKEVERMKAEGGLQRCDNCRRILVVI